MCTFAPMRRKLKSWEIMRVIFPEVLADYFEIVDVTESDTSVDIFMDEREFMEREDYKLGTVRSYGFTEERVIQDFPIRGKASYLHVRRRKWRDSSTGEIFSYSYDDLTAEGSKLRDHGVGSSDHSIYHHLFTPDCYNQLLNVMLMFRV